MTGPRPLASTGLRSEKPERLSRSPSCPSDEAWLSPRLRAQQVWPHPHPTAWSHPAHTAKRTDHEGRGARQGRLARATQHFSGPRPCRPPGLRIPASPRAPAPSAACRDTGGGVSAQRPPHAPTLAFQGPGLEIQHPSDRGQSLASGQQEVSTALRWVGHTPAPTCTARASGQACPALGTTYLCQSSPHSPGRSWLPRGGLLTRTSCGYAMQQDTPGHTQ